MEKLKRRYDIDWLRVLLIFSVYLFHCARFFAPWGWHVKDEVVSPGFTIFMEFLQMWMLPSIFIVSSASIRYSLGFQKPGRFVRGKLTRLLVPLVFGIFVLSPHQVYFEDLTYGQFSGSFIKWFPRFFDGLYGFGGNFAWMGLHLWYLLFLLLFTLILRPRSAPITRQKLAKNPSFHLLSLTTVIWNFPN